MAVVKKTLLHAENMHFFQLLHFNLGYFCSFRQRKHSSFRLGFAKYHRISSVWKFKIESQSMDGYWFSGALRGKITRIESEESNINNTNWHVELIDCASVCIVHSIRNCCILSNKLEWENISDAPIGGPLPSDATTFIKPISILIW